MHPQSRWDVQTRREDAAHVTWCKALVNESHPPECYPGHVARHSSLRHGDPPPPKLLALSAAVLHWCTEQTWKARTQNTDTAQSPRPSTCSARPEEPPLRCAPCLGTDRPQGLAPRPADLSVWGCWVMSTLRFLCSLLGH